MPIDPSQVAAPGAPIDPSEVGPPEGKPTEGPSILSKAEGLAERYDPTDVNRLKSIYHGTEAEIKDIRSAFHGAQHDPNILHAATDLYGKLPWHALNALFTPVTTAFQQGAIDPLDRAIQAVTNKIAGVFPKGPANQPGLRVTQSDVRQTGRGLESGANALANAAFMVSGGAEAEPHLPTEEPPVEKPPEEIGGGKPRVRVTGTTPEGKPRVRVMTPEEASAGVSKAAREIAEPAREIKQSPLWDSFHSLEAKVRPLFNKMGDEVLKPEGLPRNNTIKSGDLIDKILLPNSDRQIAPLLRRLRQFVPDVEVSFRPVLIGATDWGLGPDYGTLGKYRWHGGPDITKPGEIEIATGEHNAYTGRTVIHELVHAATSRFIDSHPDSPEVQELKELYSKVRRSTLPLRQLQSSMGEELARTSTGASRLFYGEHDIHEFVAEALSNPKFQNFLAKLKVAGKNAWHALSSIILDMLGMKGPQDQNLLHHVMSVSSRIMERQQEMDKAGFEPLAPGWDEEVEARSQAMKVNEVPKNVKDSPPVRKLAAWIDELQRAFAPETLGERAKKAATIIASRTSEFMHENMVWRNGSAERLKYWERNRHLAAEFIRRVETGTPFEDPKLENLRQSYRRWNQQIAQRDLEHLGLDYIPRDNYLMHIFKDPEAVAKWMSDRFGKKWFNPGFIKDRTFDLYQQAIEKGFKPRFENPEEIMLARQMASDKAAMQINILEDMRKNGFAMRKPKGLKPKPGMPVETWRAPNGQMYLMHRDAWTVMSNAFGPSMWQMPGIRGDIFRGYMHLKNAVIPLKLAFSLFHPIHVVQLDNANAATYALAEALSGKRSPISTLGELAKGSSILYKPLYENPKIGSRLVKVWRGEIPSDQLTDTDLQALQYMTEGGFVPRLSDVFRSKAVENFNKALLQHSIKSVWRLPMAILHGMSYPIFEVWIPNLKAAAYIRGVSSALMRDPSLYDDAMKRGMAFRRIAKSIDNRYGEMSYDTLFINKYIKDLGVANTLSLGWQMGFIREYGGGALELGQWAKDGFTPQAVGKGNLDRALFSVVSSTMALALGGLMTKALSGQNPQGIEDYIWPRTGDTNSSGQPHRLQTPFYMRQFGEIQKHMQNEGVIGGLSDMVRSKSAGIFGLMYEWMSGVGSYGKEIRDPNAPIITQAQQTASQMLKDLEPISFSSMRRAYTENFGKGLGLALAGFTPAPRYVTETPLEGQISKAYDRYEGHAVTPYDQAQRSDDYRKLRAYYNDNDGRFYQQLNEMEDKYQLTDSDIFRITKSLEDNLSPSVRMFMRLPWEEQKRLLDQMSPSEQQIYLPHSNVAHLRYSYTPGAAQ